MKSYLLYKRTKMLALQFLYKRDVGEECTSSLGGPARRPCRSSGRLPAGEQALKLPRGCCDVPDTLFCFPPFQRAVLFSLVLTFLLLISSSPQHNFQITNNDKNNVHEVTDVKHCHLSPLKPLGYSA